MFLADIGVYFPDETQDMVMRARKAHCLFHGLVRWWRRAMSDPSRGAHLAFDSLADRQVGAAATHPALPAPFRGHLQDCSCS